MALKQGFGKTASNIEAELYILKNANGVEAAITNYGAALVWLKVPDRNGKFVDIIHGYDDVTGYENDSYFLGATIGRYGNRIAHGQFSINGVTYQLPLNDGPNHLHGGLKGFNKVLWRAEDVSTSDLAGVKLSYVSKDGEEGYPGNLSVSVTYTLNKNNELKIDYAATTDKETVVNLTNHSYFNLAGTGDILRHQVTLHASKITLVDKRLIPTGKMLDVKGTPFDFNTATEVGARIGQEDEQLKLGGGYDHNWVLDHKDGHLTKAVEVFEPTSGRVMELFTTEPGVQFYTGNFLGEGKGKDGRPLARRSAFCFEPQHFPDSPNKPEFPSTFLKPDEEYRSTSVYKFSVRS